MVDFLVSFFWYIIGGIGVIVAFVLFAARPMRRGPKDADGDSPQGG